MTEVPLPPLPLIPASNTERIALVRWATEAVLQERERCAALAKLIDNRDHAEWLVEAIRKG